MVVFLGMIGILFVTTIVYAAVVCGTRFDDSRDQSLQLEHNLGEADQYMCLPS